MILALVKKRTQGSETSQYLEEKKLICISIVAASEMEEAQTTHHSRDGFICHGSVAWGCKVITSVKRGKLQNYLLDESAGKHYHRR